MIEHFLVIIGAMKSGTTTLYDLLRQHPRIAASRIKEPDFFTSDRNWECGLHWYEQLWTEWEPTLHRYALEGSTHYTKRPKRRNAAHRMASLGRQFKLLYIVRDPVERIESHLTHEVFSGAITQRLPIQEHTHVLDVTRYGYQIQRYLEFFSRSDILIVDFNELKKNPSRVLAQVFSFLDVESVAGIRTDVHSNAAATYVHEHPIWKGLKQNSWLRKFVSQHVSPEIREAVRQRLGRPATRQRLSLEERRRALDVLHSDHLLFEELTGFDVSMWYK